MRLKNSSNEVFTFWSGTNVFEFKPKEIIDIPSNIASGILSHRFASRFIKREEMTDIEIIKNKISGIQATLEVIKTKLNIT